MTDERAAGSKRTMLIVVLTTLTVVIAVAIAVAVASVRSENLDQGASASEAPASGAVADKNLTLNAARIVYDTHVQAKESGDAEAFQKSTCREFIDADMSLRGQKNLQELLSAYARARKFVPVQFIENQSVVGASSTGTEGKIEVSAKVTDNRFVPPTTEQRVIVWNMSYEEGVWKFCPTTDPV